MKGLHDMTRYMLISLLSPIVLAGCDVHEFPDMPETVPFHLRLRYDTDMTVWEHVYDGGDVSEAGLGGTYDNARESGQIRYVIRAYPLSEKRNTAQEHTEELVFTRDAADGYDCECTLELPGGNYNIMVWSDLVRHDGDTHFHNADDFSEISLQGGHSGNTDYRDAYRGTNSISLATDIRERAPDTLDVAMQRPLAKYEFITNDVVEFVEKEATRMAATRGEETKNGDGSPTRAVNVEDYKVVFYYVGFMPDTYSMFTDKPVDSSTGVLFESSLSKLSESEASLGFDYVMVNGKESAVTVRIGILDKEGAQLSLTGPIDVPLKRSHHTILKGMFLMSKSSGGVNIDPGFDGDHNLIFP